MKRSSYDSALERLNQYVKEKGLRVSPIRDFVLEQACKLHQPFTAEQLKEVCKEQRISSGTIYNSLNIFVSAQILHAINRQRGRASIEYELIVNNAAHMQYICTKCGRTVDFTDKALTRLIKERKYSNFNVQHFSLIVYGECKQCRTTKKTNGTL